MNKGWRKALLLTLCITLTAGSLAGCSKKEEESFDPEATAMTIGGEDIPAGLVNFAVHYTQSMMQYMYDSYFGENSFSYEYSEGYTIGDMVKSQALYSLEEMILAKQHMDEYDISLTDEEISAADEAASEFIAANDDEVLNLMTATEDTVSEFLQLCAIQEKMEPAMSADVDTEVSDEEAAQRRVKYVLVPAETEEEEEEVEAESEDETEPVFEEAVTEAETAVLEDNEAEKTQSADEDETEVVEEEEESESETEDPETVAAMAEAYAKAEQIIALIEGGMDFDDAIAEIDDSLSSYENTFGADSTVIAEGLIEATDGVPDDTLITEPVEASSGYYVVYVVNELDREATEEEKESIIEDRKSEMISDLYTEWEEEADVTTNEEIMAEIQFNFNLNAYEDEEEESDIEAAEEESGIIEEEEAVTEFYETEESVTESATE